MKVTKNPSWSEQQHADFTERIKETGGCCPCRIQHTPENQCLCREFRQQLEDPTFHGVCHCGRYVKENA